MSTQSSQKEKYCIAFWNDKILEITDRLVCKEVRDQVRGGRKDMKVKVTQLCPTLCDPMEDTVHGILRPEYYSLSLLQWIFPTQELNWDLLYFRWILYQLSYQGSPERIWVVCELVTWHPSLFCVCRVDVGTFTGDKIMYNLLCTHKSWQN